MSTTILAIVEPGWFGVRRAMYSYTPHVVTPQDARDAIDCLAPRIVLFGCYMPEWRAILQHAHARGCMCVCTWFASYTLNEFNRVNRKWLDSAFAAYREGLFARFAFAHRGMADAWTTLGHRADYLPLTVSLVPPPTQSREGVHIGILGSAQPWKNMECQLLAAHLAVPSAVIHVQTVPPRGSVAHMMNIPHVVHSTHADDDAYYALVGSMTINMCVSMSETYSYLTAESLLMGTPVLASHNTPIVQHLTGEHPLSVCRTIHFDDPFQLAQDIRNLIAVSPTLGTRCIEYMTAYDAKERVAVSQLISQWQQYLSMS